MYTDVFERDLFNQEKRLWKVKSLRVKKGPRINANQMELHVL